MVSSTAVPANDLLAEPPTRNASSEVPEGLSFAGGAGGADGAAAAAGLGAEGDDRVRGIVESCTW